MRHISFIRGKLPTRTDADRRAGSEKRPFDKEGGQTNEDNISS